MAFNGSTRFKPGEVFSILNRSARSSVRTSTHPRASIRPSCSTCRRTNPRRSPGFTARRFRGGLTLDPERVDKERGVVIEEWRRGLAPDPHPRQAVSRSLPLALRRRLPIGKPRSSAPPATRLRVLRRVPPGADGGHRGQRHRSAADGNGDPQHLRSDAPAPRASSPDTNVPLHPDTIVSVTTDPELTSCPSGYLETPARKRITRGRLPQDDRRAAGYGMFNSGSGAT
jgi:hypothetical protein